MNVERRITEGDKALLASYRDKCREVSSFTLACLAGTQTGLMLFGDGGNGKSFSIRETLAERKVREIQPEDKDDDDGDDGDEEPSPAKEWGFDTWVNHQGRITPKGLVKSMARFPQSLHLVEDAETIFDDKNCWGVLRMTLHSQDHGTHSKRRVTWETSTKDNYDFFFTGSLVIVGNRVLSSDVPEIEAVKTRCPYMNFNVSNAELVAKMKQLCERGYKEICPLTSNECYDVLEFILTAIEDDPELKKDSRGKDKKLNLRILISGFRHMAFNKIEPSVRWRDMLLSQLKQRVGAAKRTRRDRVAEEIAIANEIAGKSWRSTHDKLIEWCRLTGREVNWADSPKESPEYVKGFRSSKTDFNRKCK